MYSSNYNHSSNDYSLSHTHTRRRIPKFLEKTTDGQPCKQVLWQAFIFPRRQLGAARYKGQNNTLTYSFPTNKLMHSCFRQLYSFALSNILSAPASQCTHFFLYSCPEKWFEIKAASWPQRGHSKSRIMKIIVNNYDWRIWSCDYNLSIKSLNNNILP